MQGKYLITTDAWFIAPDGNQYLAVWGDVTILPDSHMLGISTNRNSSNWYAKVGTEENHVIVAGCQIHYAVRSEEKPSDGKCREYSIDANGYHEAESPSKIYFAK